MPPTDPAPLTSSAPAGHPTPIAKTAETFDRHYANRIMLLLAGIVLVVLYIEGMLTPSLPTIQHDFNVDAAQVTLIISAYAAAGVALSPVIGKLGDIYGKRKIMIAVMFTYAASVTVTGFSPTFAFMVGARTIQGVGLTILPLGMSLMREEFPKEMVPRAQGILSAMFGIGFAISLPLGSWVSQDFGWRWTYHSAVPFVIIMAVLVFLLVKESPYRRPDTPVDYLGALFLGLGLAGIVAALSQGESWGWTSDLTVGFAAFGAIMFLPFVLVERRLTLKKREPIVDIHLLAERNVTVTNIVLTVAGLGMYLALFSLIYQFEYPLASGGYNSSCVSLANCNFNILRAGIDILPLAIGMTIVALAASVVVSKVGVKPLALTGGLITALGFLLEGYATNLTSALVIEVVVGGGIGLLNASIINLLILTVDPKDMGQATAMNNVFRNVGGSVGAPIAGSLLATYILTSGVAIYFPDHRAFQYAFAIAAAITVIGTLTVVFAQEVLGPRRHEKFAHLPTLPGRAGRGALPAAPPPAADARPSEGPAASLR
ncbi:MAG: MFS transporter [Thermoplasmata archaeon]